jgi:hypothetical protein
VSLVARALETAGIATVVVGSARDIVEHCGVPRFLSTDFPLGNPCGRPWDEASQRDIVGRAFDLLEQARAPCTTVVRPQVWDNSGAWKEAYMRVGEDNRAALRATGDERRATLSAAKNCDDAD